MIMVAPSRKVDTVWEEDPGQREGGSGRVEGGGGGRHIILPTKCHSALNVSTHKQQHQLMPTTLLVGYLCSSCQQQLFEQVMQHLLTSLNQEKASPSSMMNTRTFIQAIGAIR